MAKDTMWFLKRLGAAVLGDAEAEREVRELGRKAEDQARRKLSRESSGNGEAIETEGHGVEDDDGS